MKFDLIISDYDGTLGGVPENTIDEQTVSAINKYIDKGGKFVVCTGRMFSSIQSICKKVGLKGIVVAFQGAMIKDIESGESYFEGGVDPDVAVEVCKEYFKQNELVVAYLGDTMYYQQRNDYLGAYERLVNTKAICTPDLIQTIKDTKEKISKLCILCEKEKAFALADKFNKEFDQSKVVFNNGANIILEAVNPNNTKKFAVEFLSKYFNIPYDKILTVGDSTNDIGLIVGDWHGVAVGDGREELKAVAKEITVPYKEKPVKYLIEKYCLND